MRIRPGGWVAPHWHQRRRAAEVWVRGRGGLTWVPLERQGPKLLPGCLVVYIPGDLYSVFLQVSNTSSLLYERFSIILHSTGVNFSTM